MTMPRILSAVRSPSFRTFWISMWVIQGGYWVSWVSLQLVVSKLTHASSSAVGLLTFFSLIPFLLLLPFAGLVADRYERRLVLLASQLGLATMAAVLAAITLLGLTSETLVFVLAFVLGIGQAMGAPAQQAIVADAVPRDDLVSAVSLTAVTFNVARMAFPVAAVPLVWWGGPQAAFALYAVAAVLASLLISRVRLPRPEHVQATAQFWPRLRHGWDHARERPPAMTALSMVAVTGLFASCMGAYTPVIASRILHRGDAGFFALTAAVGIGAAAGALLVGFLRGQTRLGRLMLLMVALGVSFGATGLSTSYDLTLAIVIVYGSLLFALQTVLATTLQFLIDDNSRGRVMALYQLAWAGLVPVGSLGIGLLGAALTPTVAMVAFGSVTAAYGLVLFAFDRLRPARASASAPDTGLVQQERERSEHCTSSI
jgi:MFS family permease